MELFMLSIHRRSFSAPISGTFHKAFRAASYIGIGSVRIKSGILLLQTWVRKQPRCRKGAPSGSFCENRQYK